VAFDDGMTAQFEMSGRYQQWLPQVVLLDPAGTVVLKESRGRRFWMLFGSLFVAAWGIGVIALHSNSWLGWVGALLFCVAAFFIVMQLVRPDSLTLAADAFTYTSLGRRFRYAWTDVAEFGVMLAQVIGAAGTTRQVGIRMKTGSTLVRLMVSGPDKRFDKALPDTYGLSVDELIALIEEWRAAAASRP
jgi:hypothetical protein